MKLEKRHLQSGFCVPRDATGFSVGPLVIVFSVGMISPGCSEHLLVVLACVTHGSRVAYGLNVGMFPWSD